MLLQGQSVFLATWFGTSHPALQTGASLGGTICFVGKLTFSSRLKGQEEPHENILELLNAAQRHFSPACSPSCNRRRGL